MAEPTHYIYSANPAEISRIAARSANDSRAEVGDHAGAARVANDDADANEPPPGFPTFPLRSIPKWEPTEG